MSVRIRGTLTPDTYKPVLSLVVLPLDNEDQFTPGEYFSPRVEESGAGEAAAVSSMCAFLLLAIVL